MEKRQKNDVILNRTIVVIEMASVIWGVKYSHFPETKTELGAKILHYAK
jgi:hypothetical protein